MRLRVTEKTVSWNDGTLNLPLRVLAAIRLGDRIIVVHDYMAYPRQKPAPNLVAYSLTGEYLWAAQNLERGFGETDAYVGFDSEDPLWVGNFAGFSCRIDPETGRLLETIFTK